MVFYGGENYKFFHFFAPQPNAYSSFSPQSNSISLGDGAEKRHRQYHQGHEVIMIPSKKYVKFYALIGLILGVVVLSASIAPADENQSESSLGVAIKGYDPVAYFTLNKAVQGSSEFTYTWNDASWFFSTPENRDLFAANPEKYAPKRGGFCAVSLIAGKVAQDNPEDWAIIDGNLYLGWE